MLISWCMNNSPVTAVAGQNERIKMFTLFQLCTWMRSCGWTYCTWPCWGWPAVPWGTAAASWCPPWPGPWPLGPYSETDHHPGRRHHLEGWVEEEEKCVKHFPQWLTLPSIEPRCLAEKQETGTLFLPHGGFPRSLKWVVTETRSVSIFRFISPFRLASITWYKHTHTNFNIHLTNWNFKSAYTRVNKSRQSFCRFQEPNLITFQMLTSV